MEIKRTPKLGEVLPFFDDGKYSPSRMYLATVVQILTLEESKHKRFILWNWDCIDSNANLYHSEREIKSLYDIWQDAIDEHRQSEGFKVLRAGASSEVGAPWLYAEDTDSFICCAIPAYDDNLIWFARTVDGGWFSLEIQNSWQCGKLDVDLDMFNRYKEDYPDVYNEYINKITHGKENI